MDDRLKAAGLLFASNTFMTIAWYGHLRFKNPPPRLFIAILASWGIALFEYILQVPANRIGYRVLSAVPAQGHAGGDSRWWSSWSSRRCGWGEGFQVRYLISFALVMAAVVVAFR